LPDGEIYSGAHAIGRECCIILDEIDVYSLSDLAGWDFPTFNVDKASRLDVLSYGLQARHAVIWFDASI
jgi:hypothetical protein